MPESKKFPNRPLTGSAGWPPFVGAPDGKRFYVSPEVKALGLNGAKPRLHDMTDGDKPAEEEPAAEEPLG